jgi:hypothetical protein
MPTTTSVSRAIRVNSAAKAVRKITKVVTCARRPASFSASTLAGDRRDTRRSPLNVRVCARWRSGGGPCAVAPASRAFQKATCGCRAGCRAGSSCQRV